MPEVFYLFLAQTIVAGLWLIQLIAWIYQRRKQGPYTVSGTILVRFSKKPEMMECNPVTIMTSLTFRDCIPGPNLSRFTGGLHVTDRIVLAEPPKGIKWFTFAIIVSCAIALSPDTLRSKFAEGLPP